MTKERIEEMRKAVLPFVKKKLVEINYEGLGKGDAKEFEKDFNELLNLASKALEQDNCTLDDAREDFVFDVYNILDFLPTNNEANRIIDVFDRVTTYIEQKPCEDAVSRKAVNELFDSEIKMYKERIETRKGSNYHDETERIKEFRSRIANAEYWQNKIKALSPVTAAQKWIPCNKRLPEEETDVLICNSKGNIEVSRGSVFDDGTWEWYTSGWHFGEVLAWMPIPEPYEEETESEE